jgi:hypothetical protein
MGSDKIEESQQSRDGIAIGTQGNQAGKSTAGMKGPHEKPQQQQDISIPNQERSSASNQQESGKDDNSRS